MRVKSQVRRVESQRLRLRARTLTSDLRFLTASRRGLTLIELLVVIIILTTLVSAAIPIMAPTNDDRRLREASRSVNAYISAAQMKAIQLQRPVGVALKRLAQDTNLDPTRPHDDNAVCVELYYVEQPAPYRGFDRTSTAMVARHPTLSGRVLIKFVSRGTSDTTDGLPIGWDADLFPPGVIRPGDVVEIDGTRYQLFTPPSPTGWANVRVNTDTGYYEAQTADDITQIEAQPLNDTGQMLNVEFDSEGRRLRDPILTGSAVRNSPFWTNTASYKILRQPMPTSAEPFQMPDGTAIDLRASGQAIEIDTNNGTAAGFFHDPDAIANSNDRINNQDPIVIMFTPEGAIERVRFNRKDVASTNAVERSDNVYDGRTVSNIYLLVGRRQNAPPPALAVDKSLDPSYTSLTDQQKQEVKETTNWLLGESRWIVIGAQSGRVVTVQNAFVEPGRFLPPNQTGQPLDLLRAQQINAAREYGREMLQVGGR